MTIFRCINLEICINFEVILLYRGCQYNFLNLTDAEYQHFDLSHIMLFVLEEVSYQDKVC